MGIPEGSTPRSSGRLREKAQRKFEMPTRDQVLGAIQITPGKSYEQYKPRKLINNFLKERNTYNNRDDPLEMTDDEEGLSDFIVEDEPSSFESKARNKGKKKTKEKKRQQIQLSSESSSERSDFIVEDEPPQVRLKRKNRKTRKQRKAEWSSESASDAEEVTSDFIEEDKVSDSGRSVKKTPKRMKRILSSSESDSDKSNGVILSRRSRRICKQPKKEFQKPDKKKAWENILEKEPDLNEAVDSDDVTDFVVGDEEVVEEEASNSETDLEKEVGEDSEICEKSDTEEAVITKGDVKLDAPEDVKETSLPEIFGDKLNKTDENFSRLQEDIGRGTEGGKKTSSVLGNIDLTETGCERDDTESDSESREVARNLRSKIHHRRQVTKSLDSDGSESDDEKINDAFIERKRRRTSKSLNSDDDDDEDDSGGGGGRKEYCQDGEEEKAGETR